MTKRRFFLVALIALLAAGGAWFSFVAIQERIVAQWLADLSARASIPVRRALEPVSAIHGHNRIQADPVTNWNTRRYLRVLDGALARYPAQFFQCADVRGVVLCTRLSLDGQPRSAIPSFVDGIIYVDVERGAHNREYQVMAFHHEFFHLIDYRDDGHVYEDAEWIRLNHELFKYGNGGASVQHDLAFAYLQPAPDGFASAYGTTGVEEDKAEIFAHLIHNHDAIMLRAAKDPVLEAKLDQMKQLIENFCAAAPRTIG